jgi:hypothetical protein
MSKCTECSLAFPTHELWCYHIDCDNDDYGIHGCGIEEGE